MTVEHAGGAGGHPRPRGRLTDIAEKTRRSTYLSHSDYTVPEMMAEMVRQVPDRVAIESGDETITYAELQARANQVAHALLDRHDDRTTPVLLLCDHGIAPPVAICGALHAGLVAAPVDVKEPVDRLRRLLVASGADLVVTDRLHVELAHNLAERVLVLDETTHESESTPDVVIGEEDPGLILFTSGSTGLPKGVFGTHRSIVPKSMRFQPGSLVGDERWSLTASWGFVAAEGQLFSGLTNGFPTCTYDMRTRGPRGFPEWVRDHAITHLNLLPSVARTLVDDTRPGTMDCVRQVAFGAETLYAADVRAVRPLFAPDTVLQNAIGSTEVGRISGWDLPPDDELDDGPVPVGMPGPNVEVRLVDEDDQPVPEGEPGRIVVVRRGHLAKGYWRDPVLTAAHFFREPDGRQGFRTSDRARLRPDGMLDHLGRLDTRVKVRGAMVATSEVEIALMGLPGVGDAAVIAVDGADGGTRLVAYVVADGSAPLSAWRLRRDVATRVPTTMVPAAFVAVDALPRTIRHKIDRAALPPPPPPPSRPYRAPHDEFFEARLADLFAEVLGVERVGIDDDFFDLGGDSLGVLELLAAINEVFRVELPARAVLEAPTVAQLAPRLPRWRDPAASPVVTLRADGDGRPFFGVPGGGATALALLALAQAVDGHPFYGVQARGLEERAAPDRTVEAIAVRNVDAIRAVQQRGPYVLGGHSFGGMVAFEMACLLRAAGDEVDAVVMFDAGPPLGGHGRSPIAALPRPSERSAPRAALSSARSAYERARARVVAASAGRLPRHGLAQYEAFYELHVAAARRYRPSRTFDGRIAVLRAGPVDDLGWSELTTGPVTVVPVPGDHLTMLRPPAVREVGRRLGEILG